MAMTNTVWSPKFANLFRELSLFFSEICFHGMGEKSALKILFSEMDLAKN
jgi:hypothetical protein